MSNSQKTEPQENSFSVQLVDSTGTIYKTWKLPEYVDSKEKKWVTAHDIFQGTFKQICNEVIDEIL